MKIKSTLTSPAFNNRIGNVPAMSNVPYLDVLSTRSLDGNKLYISIINRSESDDYFIPISINGVDVASSGVCRSISAEHYLDANSWDEPDKIGIKTNTIPTGTSFGFNAPKLSVTVIELNISGLEPIDGPVLCGIVQDTYGTPVSGATVTLSNGLSAMTDDNGYYEVSVPAGSYWVDVAKDGYNSQRMENIYVYALAGTMAQPIILPISN